MFTRMKQIFKKKNDKKEVVSTVVRKDRMTPFHYEPNVLDTDIVDGIDEVVSVLSTIVATASINSDTAYSCESDSPKSSSYSGSSYDSESPSSTSYSNSSYDSSSSSSSSYDSSSSCDSGSSYSSD